MNEKKPVTRGRPKGASKKKVDRHVIQIRMNPELMQRFMRAKEQEGVESRCEYLRMLMQQSLQAKGF